MRERAVSVRFHVPTGDWIVCPFGRVRGYGADVSLRERRVCSGDASAEELGRLVQTQLERCRRLDVTIREFADQPDDDEQVEIGETYGLAKAPSKFLLSFYVEHKRGNKSCVITPEVQLDRRTMSRDRDRSVRIALQDAAAIGEALEAFVSPSA